MKVQKRTKVNVGDGSAAAIVDALKSAGLPIKARATDISTDWSTITPTGLLQFHSPATLSMVMTFEWADDE